MGVGVGGAWAVGGAAEGVESGAAAGAGEEGAICETSISPVHVLRC